jgi:heme oxygenase (mycobilin-producing)
MSRVILINPFEVAPSLEASALAYWDRAAAHLRRQPGYRWARLHRAVSPGARFLYVNVAEWDSAAHFGAAVGSDAFRRLTGPEADRFPHHPALYEIIRDE